jgi:hypothetical protein
MCLACSLFARRHNYIVRSLRYEAEIFTDVNNNFIANDLFVVQEDKMVASPPPYSATGDTYPGGHPPQSNQYAGPPTSSAPVYTQPATGTGVTTAIRVHVVVFML